MSANKQMPFFERENEETKVNAYENKPSLFV
ncbi:MAG: hypothetical protein ACJAYB_000017 [Psychromonas sp.]|jgi:hypothetical protein